MMIRDWGTYRLILKMDFQVIKPRDDLGCFVGGQDRSLKMDNGGFIVDLSKDKDGSIERV